MGSHLQERTGGSHCYVQCHLAQEELYLSRLADEQLANLTLCQVSQGTSTLCQPGFL